MKEKIKLVIVFIIGIIISTVISVYAATVITAGEVSYTSNSNTTVESGLNNLYTRANSTANDVTNLGTRVTQLETTYCKSYSGYSHGATVSIGFTTKVTMIGIIIGSWANINSFNIQPSVIALNNGVNTFTMPTLRDSSGNIANSTAKDVFICWFRADIAGM